MTCFSTAEQHMEKTRVVQKQRRSQRLLKASLYLLNQGEMHYKPKDVRIRKNTQSKTSSLIDKIHISVLSLLPQLAVTAINFHKYPLEKEGHLLFYKGQLN